jgi:hypothetical protein
MYVGLDVGETFALGITAFHRPSNTLRRMKVKMRALYRYKDNLKKEYSKKRDDSPHQVQLNESAMSKVMAKRGFHLSTDTGPPPSENPVAHLRDYCQTLTQLSQFQSSRKLLDLYWRAKRAKKSEFDRVVQQILIMIGGGSHLRAGNRKIVFGIGHAKVKGWAGPLLQYLVVKLKSLGYNHIYYVNESYTSQYCPRCGSTATLVGKTRYRVKHCSNWHCNTYFHRDEMAGHNIANTLEFYAHHGRRPDYLPIYGGRGRR